MFFFYSSKVLGYSARLKLQKAFQPRTRARYEKLIREATREDIAKLIVVDRVIAISSSMNFYSSSSAGSSWEAGLVSIDKTVVESIVDAILGLLEKPESKELL